MKKIILPLIILFNFIYTDCPEDLNGDGIANVVDIVSLVNFILNSDGCQDSTGDGGSIDCEGLVDQCGVCNGDNSSCLDDCGIVNGDNSCLNSALAQANLVLENVLVNLYSSDGSGSEPPCCDDDYWDWYYGNDDDTHPSEIDFSPAYDSYMYALSLNSEDPNANFGAALTNFLMVTQDPILWEIFDEWDSNGDWLIPADDDLGRVKTQTLVGAGFPLNSADLFSISKLNISNYIPIGHIFDFADDYRTTFDYPLLSEFQDMIDDVFITRLNDSIEYMDNVFGKDFTFTITPLMQNDEYQSALEMDDAEFYAFKSTLHLLRALLMTINTYSLEGPNNPMSQYNGDFSWLESGGDFLSMREGASGYLPLVHDDLNSIVTSFQNIYYFVQNETDYQGNDIILWQDINDPDAEEEIFNNIPNMLNNNIEAELCSGDAFSYYNMDTGTWEWTEQDCIDVVMNIGNFLNNPLQDIKELFPDYHLVLDTDIDDEYFSGWTYQNINSIDECSEYSDSFFCEQNGCEWFSNQCNGMIYCNSSAQCHVSGNDNDDDNLISLNELNYSQECYANPDLYTFVYQTVEEYFNTLGNITVQGDNEEWWNDGYIDIYFDYFDTNENSECYQDCSDIENWAYDGDFSCGKNVRISGQINGINAFEPCLVFDAASYGNWCDEWDYTLNGLFPEMTQWDFINTVLETSEEDWLDDQECD